MKPKQEFHLKVKNFLPPLSPEPAIYIAKPASTSSSNNNTSSVSTAKVVGNQSVIHNARGATATKSGQGADGQYELRLADGQSYTYSTMSKINEAIQ